MQTLKDIRSDMGWTQQRMADAIGVSLRAYQDNEAGNPTHGLYVLAAKGLAEAAFASETKTLRDEFAMAALTGILASPEHVSDVEIITGSAYQWADAMLKARDQ